MYLFLQNVYDYSKIISMEPLGVLTARRNPHDVWQLFSNVILKPRHSGFPEADNGRFSISLPAAPKNMELPVVPSSN